MITYERVTNGNTIHFRTQGNDKSSWNQTGMDDLTTGLIEGVDYEIVEVDETPVLSVDEKREAAYNAAGVTPDKMIVALYEKIVEGKTDAETGITDMQTKRNKVKMDHPKS